MSDICYVFLAYGDDYIKEFLRIAPFFPKEHILVYSNREIEDYNTLTTKKPFNFNLKLTALTKALKKYNKVLLLDTDTTIKDFNPDLLSKLDSGLTVKWFGKRVTYLGRSITSKSLTEGSTSFSDVNEYGKTLFDEYKNTIKFIDESCLFFNFTNEHQKTMFKSTLEYYFLKLKNKYPIRENKPGSLEGCLLYVIASQVNLNIYKNKQIFDKMFYHYGPVSGHNNSFKQKVL